MSDKKDKRVSREMSLITRVTGLQKKSAILWMSLLFVASGGYYEASYNRIVELNYVQQGTEEFYAQLNDSNKKGLVLFYTDYCFPCESMNDMFLQDNELAVLVNQSFIPYKVDAFDKGEGIVLKEKYNIKHFPTLLITGEEGNEIGRIDLFEGKEDFAEKLRSLAKDELFQKVVLKNKAPKEKKKDFIPESLASPIATIPSQQVSLSLETFDTYTEARSSALLSTKLWKKEIWIEETEAGKYEVLLGLFKDENEGDMAKNYLKNWEGVESNIQHLNTLAQRYE